MILLICLCFSVPASAEVPLPAPKPNDLAKPPPLKLDKAPAKQLFGAEKLPNKLKSRSIGFYAKGCLAGAKPLAIDGPAWQVMRLSRNRNWGHPVLISTLEKLAAKVKAETKWPGLLVGDISQPRGGPMLTGHASHQVGLDADVWLNPMPKRTFTAREREDTSAVSMANAKFSGVNPKVWTPEHLKVIRLAATMPGVERVLVNPVIKKQLCTDAVGDRSWLAKVRPYWGHDYHMHIRIGCPSGSDSCKAQAAIPGDEECGAPLDAWLKKVRKPDVPPPPPKDKPKPTPPPKPIMLSDLPGECRTVLEAPDADFAPTVAAPGVKPAADPDDQAATPDPTGQDTPVPPTPQ
ncbi:penicillin-insensitive murein endopeptidase [Terrihabitans soli]|uniref:penicillin-insensitive murein endopeptidase n=1 Tax=Terrihabitans soli TaxID=708113 RepID=UPI001CA313F3